MDAPKGKPSAILKDRARGCSRDSASVQADKEKKPGEARPFFPSGLPHGCAPQGSLHRRGEGTGADGHARGAESRTAQKDVRTHGVRWLQRSRQWLQLDIEEPFRLGGGSPNPSVIVP